MDLRETKEIVVVTDSPELVDLMERKDRPDQKVPKESLVVKDNVVKLEPLGQQALPVRRDRKEPLVPVVPLELLATLLDHVV